MASLMQIARQTADDFRDGIQWVIVWKTGRSWHAETVHLDPVTDKFEYEDDKKLAYAIAKADSNAKILNGYIHGGFGEDSTVKEIAEGIRWLYEYGSDLLCDELPSLLESETTAEKSTTMLDAETANSHETAENIQKQRINKTTLRIINTYTKPDGFSRCRDSFQAIAYVLNRSGVIMGRPGEYKINEDGLCEACAALHASERQTHFLLDMAEKHPQCLSISRTGWTDYARIFDVNQLVEFLLMEYLPEKEIAAAKKSAATLDEKKIIKRIKAMPIEELVEKFTQTLEESHIPYTIEEGGKIQFSGIFTDKSRAPPNNG